MHFLIQELNHYHSDKAAHLMRLQQTVRWLTDNDYPRESAPELRASFEPFQGNAERAHHHNEELILRELRRTDAPIHRRVDEIHEDHLALDRIVTAILLKLERLPEATDAVCSEIQRFIQIYDDHATGEESIFFPISDQYLSAQNWTIVEREWDKRC